MDPVVMLTNREREGDDQILLKIKKFPKMGLGHQRDGVICKKEKRKEK